MGNYAAIQNLPIGRCWAIWLQHLCGNHTSNLYRLLASPTWLDPTAPGNELLIFLPLPCSLHTCAFCLQHIMHIIWAIKCVSILPITWALNRNPWVSESSHNIGSFFKMLLCAAVLFLWVLSIGFRFHKFRIGFLLSGCISLFMNWSLWQSIWKYCSVIPTISKIFLPTFVLKCQC